MICYASATRRFWACVLSLGVDLLAFYAIDALVGGGSPWPAFIAWYVIHHVGLVAEGGTLGQRALGLRVTSMTGTRVSALLACAREGAFLVLSLPPLGLGALWMLDQPERRTWHDIIASTVVVREGMIHAAPQWAEDPPWRRTMSEGDA